MKVKKTGFSLVELLVVISIIAVLSAVLMVNFVGMRERSRDTQKIQDLNAIKDALKMYYNDKQTYPYPGVSCTNASSTCLNEAIGSSYLPGIVNVGYTYAAAPDGNGFVVSSYLEIGAGDEDIESQKRCGATTPTDKLYFVCGN